VCLALVSRAAAYTLAAVPRAAVSPVSRAPHPAMALPELYVYDHCPFCVRVRLALGVTGVQHKLVFLGNDDVETPTAMVGKKIAPIWKDADGPMMESLDIIGKMDPEGTIKPSSGRDDFKKWQKEVQTLMRKLCRPRYVKVPLPEFMQKAGRDAFVNNHQMPPFEKTDWKGNADMPIEIKYGHYDTAYGESASLIAELNAKMGKLDAMIFSEEMATEGGFSYDDVDLWARLRSLTLIEGLEIPPKTRAYLDYYAAKGDVPLYDTMAI